jgi:hypothetical protein
VPRGYWRSITAHCPRCLSAPGARGPCRGRLGSVMGCLASCINSKTLYSRRTLALRPSGCRKRWCRYGPPEASACMAAALVCTAAPTRPCPSPPPMTRRKYNHRASSRACLAQAAEGVDTITTPRRSKSRPSCMGFTTPLPSSGTLRWASSMMSPSVSGLPLSALKVSVRLFVL